MQISNQSAIEKADHRIGVTVISGFLGSGKTTLLNRLLQQPLSEDTAVIINELGDVGVDHHLLRYVQGHVVVIEGGCICCAVNGDLVAALRDLFMAALRRQIPRFRRVLIETTGLAVPSGVLFALRHDPFLAERYVHRSTVTVADVVHIQAQLLAQPEVTEQLVAADCIVCSKTDLIDGSGLDDAVQCIGQINPGAQIFTQWTHGIVDELFSVRASSSKRFFRWLDGVSSLKAAHRDDVQHAVVTLAMPIARSVFLVVMDQFQREHHQNILRIKGLIRFDGEAGWSAVHGVHGDLYPLVSVESGASGEEASWLVLIMRGAEIGPLVSNLKQMLKQTAP